ncbi:hypothetical protein C8J57DRAFT_1232804 [Mycena rebaudengoi]|nr:hypothetical protein C8J57DRAFT_1232804 [Mycena rebaudengoi]
MASFVLVVEPPTKKARGVGDRSSGVHVQMMRNDAGEIVLGRQKGTIDVAFPLKMLGVGLGCSMSTQSRMLWQIEVEEYRDIAHSVSLHMFGVTRKIVDGAVVVGTEFVSITTFPGHLGRALA